ncbi:MAG: DUF1415 domain-containing protein [Methylococcales bacterium]
MYQSDVSSTQIIAQTRQWIETVVIGYQFCPFARKVFDTQTIHYQVIDDQQLEPCLQALIAQCQKLDNTNSIETTLIIYPQGYTDFKHFLELLALAEDLLVAQGHEGIYQLASFHPQYQFANTDIDEPANYTNRSPYPMLHLLREASLERAIADYPDVDAIPQRNIKHAEALGVTKMAEALACCYTLRS